MLRRAVNPFQLRWSKVLNETCLHVNKGKNMNLMTRVKHLKASLSLAESGRLLLTHYFHAMTTNSITRSEISYMEFERSESGEYCALAVMSSIRRAMEAEVEQLYSPLRDKVEPTQNPYFHSIGELKEKWDTGIGLYVMGYFELAKATGAMLHTSNFCGYRLLDFEPTNQEEHATRTRIRELQTNLLFPQVEVGVLQYVRPAWEKSFETPPRQKD